LLEQLETAVAGAVAPVAGAVAPVVGTAGDARCWNSWRLPLLEQLETAVAGAAGDCRCWSSWRRPKMKNMRNRLKKTAKQLTPLTGRGSMSVSRRAGRRASPPEGVDGTPPNAP